MEILWSILSCSSILDVFSLALLAENVLWATHRASLAAAGASVSSCLPLLHVVDASIGDALLLREFLTAVSESVACVTHDIKASQRLLSESVAAGLLLLLVLKDIPHSVGLEINSSLRVNSELSDIERKHNALLSAHDTFNDLILHQLEENLDHLGCAVTDLSDGLEANRYQVLIKYLQQTANSLRLGYTVPSGGRT